jgi:hypothetical protein
VTDAGLKELAALRALHTLDLGATRVTPAGLRGLTALKGLHTLRLSKAQVTDQALRVLRENNLLQAYHQAFGKGYARPRSAAEIDRLFLHDTPVTDAGLKELAGLKALRLLLLRGTKVTDRGVAELKKALPGVTIRR